MVLMIDRGLSGSPLSVGIREGWVLGQDSGEVPEEKIWVIYQSLGVNTMVIHNNGSVLSQTSSKTSHDEVDDPSVSDPASHVEVLDGKLSNE